MEERMKKKLIVDIVPDYISWTFSTLWQMEKKNLLDKTAAKRSDCVKYVLFDTYKRFWSHTRISKHRSSTGFTCSLWANHYFWKCLDFLNLHFCVWKFDFPQTNGNKFIWKSDFEPKNKRKEVKNCTKNAFEILKDPKISTIKSTTKWKFRNSMGKSITINYIYLALNCLEFHGNTKAEEFLARK